MCRVLGSLSKGTGAHSHYEANQFGYLVGCVHSNHCWQGPFSSRGHYCKAGCCLPGFVWTTICIHLMDCQGQGSPPEETVEWLLSKPLRGRGALIPAFAQVLGEGRALAADAPSITTEQLRSFGRSFTDPFYCLLRQGPRKSTLPGRSGQASSSDAMSRPSL